MPYFKKLIGIKCYLSPCSIDDAEAWTRWDNDLEFAIPLGDEAYMNMTLERQKETMINVLKKESQLFNIVTCEDDRLIGRCMLFHLDPVNRTAMFGIGIGEKDYWNRGFGQEATSLLLDYAFNKRGIECYKKVGFREIGRRRQARIFGDQKFDIVLMDILAEEYESVMVGKILNRQKP